MADSIETAHRGATGCDRRPSQDHGDDSLSVRSLFYAARINRQTLHLGCGTYEIGERFEPLPITKQSVGNLHIGPGYDVDVGEAWFVLHGNTAGPSAYGSYRTRSAITGPMPVGADRFPLEDTTGFSVGGWAAWRLGDVPFDTPETLNWGFAKIVEVGSHHVRLARPLVRAFTQSEFAAVPNNRHLYSVDPLLNASYGNVRLVAATGDPAQSSGLALNHGVALCAGSIYGEDMNVCTFSAQYVDGFQVASVLGNRSCRVAGNSANTGSVVRLAEARGQIGEIRAIHAERYAIYVEAASDIVVEMLHDVNARVFDPRELDRRIVTYAGGHSRLHIEDALFEGLGGHNIFEAATGGSVSFGRVDIRCTNLPYSMPMPGRDCRSIRIALAGKGAALEYYRAEDAVWWERTVTLADAVDQTLIGPPGVMVEARIVGLGGASVPDVVVLQLGRQGRPLEDCRPAGHEPLDVTRFGILGPVGGLQFQERFAPLNVRIAGARSGLTGSGKSVRICAKIIPVRRS